MRLSSLYYNIFRDYRKEKSARGALVAAEHEWTNSLEEQKREHVVTFSWESRRFDTFASKIFLLNGDVCFHLSENSNPRERYFFS